MLNLIIVELSSILIYIHRCSTSAQEPWAPSLDSSARFSLGDNVTLGLGLIVTIGVFLVSSETILFVGHTNSWRKNQPATRIRRELPVRDKIFCKRLKT